MWLGLLVSILALWLALRHVDFGRLWEALLTANYIWLIPALVLHFAGIMARIVRWQILLGRDRVDLATTFWVEHIGYLVANIVHPRVGDASRVALISQRKPVSLEHAFSTVVVERLFDVLAAVVMALALIPVMHIPDEWLTQARILGALGALGVVGAVALVALGDRAEALLATILRRIPRIKPEPWLARWRNLVGGLSALGSARGVAVVTIWTAITWGCSIGLFWVMMMAFIPQAPFHASLFVLTAEAFGMAVPATPGNWGVWELIAQQALMLLGLPEHQATSYGIVIHIFEYITINIVGLMGLLYYGLSLEQIKTQTQQPG